MRPGVDSVYPDELTEASTTRAVFGLVASLMERIPLVGLVFSISNRIGAAMWAHDVSLRSPSLLWFRDAGHGRMIRVQPGCVCDLARRPDGRLTTPLTLPSRPQLEKRQHQFRTGELRPTRVYQSKTARLAEKQAAVGIDPGVAHGPGGFPTEKGPVKIEGDGILQQRKPALPPR